MTTEVDRVVVPTDLDGMRADKAVATLVRIPRTQAHDLIDAGLVTVDGVPVSPSQRLKAGVELEVTHRGVPATVAAADVPYSVAYQDEHLLVVDKPAGVVVHPVSGVGREMLRSATLVSGLVHRYPDLAGLEEQRFGLVHRLDKDTSGLLLVARSAAVHTALQDMLRRRTIARTYLALVIGEPPATRGTIDAPIGRDRSTPTRMAVDAGGRRPAPTTGAWRAGRGRRCWRCRSSRVAPTRSGSTWPPSDSPWSGTAPTVAAAPRHPLQAPASREPRGDATPPTRVGSGSTPLGSSSPTRSPAET